MRLKFEIDKKVLKQIEKQVESLGAGPTKAECQELGNDIIAEMKAMISKGISPIDGKGRFPAYKWQGVKGKYPATQKKLGKRDRPVNLELHGDFLDELRAKVTKDADGYGVNIGWDDPEQRAKELGHRRGANGQPKRPIIPIGKESFAVKIQRLIIDAFTRSTAKK
ncbi:MAG: hypothetical protein E6R04_10680 [Spirochaetes bacterium]|nr:MAG: hypothetical protein E6R04_10680 [Spirochaetota bacterium]